MRNAKTRKIKVSKSENKPQFEDTEPYVQNFEYVDPNAIELEGEYIRQEIEQAELDEALHAAGKFVY